jgi:glycosyltransferase 2 family protein
LVLRLAIGIAVLVWLQRSGALNFHSLARLLRIWPLTLAAVGFLIFDLFLMSIRVCLLFRAQSLKLSLKDALHLTLTGFLFSMLLPGTAGGEIAKFYYAGRQNQRKRPEIAAALLFDRLIGLSSMILLPLLFAPLSSQLIRSVQAVRQILWMDALLALCLLAGLIAITLFQPFRHRVCCWLGKWPTLQDLWKRGTGVIVSYREHRVTLLYAIALSFLANFAYIVVTALGFYATSPGAFSLNVLLVAPIGHLINALPLTPGGLGVGEAAFNALFHAAGMRGGADALFCVRLWNATIALVYAAIYLWGMERRHHGHESREVREHGVIEAVRQPQFDKG